MKQYFVLRPFTSCATQFNQGDIVEPYLSGDETMFNGFLRENGYVKILDDVTTIEDIKVDISKRPEWEKQFDNFLLHHFDRWVLCTDDPNADESYAQDCACCFGTEFKNCNCVCHTRIAKLKEYIEMNFLQ